MSNSSGKIESWLSSLLRWGVASALLLIAASIVINLFTGQSWLGRTDLSVLFSGEASFPSQAPSTAAEFVFGLRDLQSTSYIQAALLVLILLPGFRVAFLMGSFLRQRDWLFGAISFTVLLIMSLGIVFRLGE